MMDTKRSSSLNESDQLQPVDRRLVHLMTNGLDELPALSSKIVRIFTSSTFTDTTLERNALMENVYPKLKEYCRERHGLEFQVVDMRWGVRDEATDDHVTTSLCLNEIENCQRLSTGPNFCVFLGQKYGYRPIPTVIPANELDAMKSVLLVGEDALTNEDARLLASTNEDARLLALWYKRDENAVPPVYTLQPISSVLTNFNNKRHPRLMQHDQTAWWESMSRLQRLLRQGARVLHGAGRLTADQMHNYFMSVTEREVRRGLIDAKEPANHCLAFIRQIGSVDTSTATALQAASNFIDLLIKHNTQDEEAASLLAALRDKVVPHHLTEENISRFHVEWTGNDGLDINSHCQYLKLFCEQFYNNVVRLVDRAVEANIRLSNDRVYSEVLQHLHACRNFCTIFQGREEVIDRLCEYLIGDCRQPLMLYGESGCGKTSLLAKAHSQVAGWLSKTSVPCMVLRFLGTSPDSSSLTPLLTSVCQQISCYYNQSNDTPPSLLTALVTHFKSLLELATSKSPLIIFLDSLDQLPGDDGAHQLGWIPAILPRNCKLVVSTLPAHGGIFETFKKLIDQSESYIEVTPLGQNLGSSIIRSWLDGAKRTVTPTQWTIVQTAIERCNLPLFVKLVFDEICTWRSYHKAQYTTLAVTIHDSIMKLFERIESQHGRVLVSHALGYITASKGGLSEAELEDLLSLDEKVLNDVYQYHVPPVRRIPPLLWTRLRNDLPNYFSEREADGVTVINWYHRQFLEASAERYFRNMNFVEETHSLLADYFLGVWGGGREKPFQYTELQRQRFGLESSRGACDRKVPEQPLYFTDARTGQIKRYNLRKLSELSHHLLRAKRLEELDKEVLFNFKWLHAKLSCMPLQTILVDMEDVLNVVQDRNVKLLADALRLSTSVLSLYPDMLGPQVLGRLLPYYTSHHKIQSLLHQCDTEGLKVNALVPTNHCLHTPGGPLQYSLEGHPFAPFGIGVTSDARYVVSVSSIFIIWHLSTGDVFRQLEPRVQGIMQSLIITSDDKLAVTYTNNNQVLVCGILTGEYRLVQNVADSTEDILGITVSNSQFIVWSSQEWRSFSLNTGQLVDSGHMDTEHEKRSIVNVSLTFTSDERYLIWKVDNPLRGIESEEDMALEVHSTSPLDTFYFHSAIALTADRLTLYTCIAISDYAVARYRRGVKNWRYHGTLPDSSDRVFSLTLSHDEHFLIAMIVFGFKLWHLEEFRVKHILHLPDSVRNIPTKNCFNNLISVTRDSRFIVAAVRSKLYVWDVDDGQLVKILDAHFGRIMALKEVSCGRVLSSSIDKSIKVWNFDYILEDVHTIDRLERSIEDLSVSSRGQLAVSTTRNCAGVWNLETGKLMWRLANGQHTTKVTSSCITHDGRYVLSAEPGSLLIWDVSSGKLLKSCPQDDIVQLLPLTRPQSISAAPDNSGPVPHVGHVTKAEPCRFIIISKSSSSSRGLCVCRDVPSGRTVFEFEYASNRGTVYKSAVITSDNLLVLVGALPGTQGTSITAECLLVYRADTTVHGGEFLHQIMPRYPGYREFVRLVAMTTTTADGLRRSLIALIDDDKGNILEPRKKTFLRSIPRWNGVSSSSGRFGLYAPERGGLEVLDLKTGLTLLTLIPRVAEGVFSTISLFTQDDRHVVYYHSGRKSIRVFRVSDKKEIADYKAHAAISTIVSVCNRQPIETITTTTTTTTTTSTTTITASTTTTIDDSFHAVTRPTSSNERRESTSRDDHKHQSDLFVSSLVLGAVDGSIVVLTIADPADLEAARRGQEQLQAQGCGQRLSEGAGEAGNQYQTTSIIRRPSIPLVCNGGRGTGVSPTPLNSKTIK